MSYVNYKRQKNSEDLATTAKYYLSNNLLLPAVIESRKIGKISSELAGYLLMLATRYASKPSFANYSFREDMVAEALADLCKNALKFNPEKSNNPFAFYTSCIHNSFLGYLNLEKKQRKIRDQMLVELGENPSYGFMAEYKASMGDDDMHANMSELKNDINDARERLEKERLRELNNKRDEQLALGQLLDFDEPDDTLKEPLPLILDEQDYEPAAISEEDEE
jgi:DNA-directed RNA polymerase specialized sigma24 family protein